MIESADSVIRMKHDANNVIIMGVVCPVLIN